MEYKTREEVPNEYKWDLSKMYQNTEEVEKNIEIPKFHVKGKFEFTGYILANENIDNFSCEGEFNELYFKSVSFSVKKATITIIYLNIISTGNGNVNVFCRLFTK